jgi:TP901 family phage tail tape measure protein
MEIAYTIKINDLISKGLNSAEKASNALGLAMMRLNKCMWQVNQTAELFDRMGNTLSEINKPGLEFEQSMADLSAITGIAGKELEALGETARELGIKSGLGAKQAAESYKILASQIDVTKIGMSGLQMLQKETITLSQASGIEMAAAAEALTGTINQFGLQASEATRIINVLGAGAKYGAAEIPDLAQSFKVVGAAANAAGISVEATAGVIEVLSKNNLKGAEAGTAMRNILLKMQSDLGVDFKMTSMSQALEALKPKLNDVTFLTKTFGMENTVAAQFLIQNASLVDEMTNRVSGTNVAFEQAAIRTNTWGHKIDIFKAKINDMGIGLYQNSGGMLVLLQMGSQLGSGILSLGPIFNGLGHVVTGTKRAFDWLSIAENRQIVADKLRTAWLAISGVAIASWGTLVSIMTGKISLLTVATMAWNAALAVNPVVWVVVGIVALVAAVALAWEKLGWFRGAVLAAWEAVKGFGIIIKDFIIDRIKGILSGLGGMAQALLQFFKGDWADAWQTAKIAAGDLIGIDASKNAIDAAKKVGGEMGTAYHKGVEEVNAKKAAAGLANEIIPGIAMPNIPGTSITPAILGATKDNTKPVEETSNAIAQGGTRNTSLNINIGNMVETISFNGTLKENATDMRRMIEQELVRALNMAYSTA